MNILSYLTCQKKQKSNLGFAVLAVYVLYNSWPAVGQMCNPLRAKFATY